MSSLSAENIWNKANTYNVIDNHTLKLLNYPFNMTRIFLTADVEFTESVPKLIVSSVL